MKLIIKIKLINYNRKIANLLIQDLFSYLFYSNSIFYFYNSKFYYIRLTVLIL